MCQDGDGVDSESVISRLMCPLQDNFEKTFLLTQHIQLMKLYNVVQIVSVTLLFCLIPSTLCIRSHWSHITCHELRHDLHMEDKKAG